MRPHVINTWYRVYRYSCVGVHNYIILTALSVRDWQTGHQLYSIAVAAIHTTKNVMTFLAMHTANYSLATYSLVLWARRSRAQMEGERASGHFRQVFVDVARMLVTPIRLLNLL